MQYIYIIIFTIAFIGGFATSNFISKREILDLKLNIEKSNLKASELLQQETKKVIDAEAIARNINEELENARKQEIETVNVYHDKLASARLFDRGHKTSCTNTVSSSTNTGINKENETSGTELSEEFDRFLKSESLRADNCAIQHNELLKFVNINCGIKVK
jgi:hypothetical protein